MATPHVAGVVALYLEKHPTATPSTVRNAIVGAAVTNKVIDAGTGSPNLLLQSLIP
ncbi:MAG: S8A family peptidase [Methylococcaceae bacterium NSP1-2]|nr:MAG: S8A family peptidase [Methylococcaceae bacterium NSP1-2]